MDAIDRAELQNVDIYKAIMMLASYVKSSLYITLCIINFSVCIGIHTITPICFDAWKMNLHLERQLIYNSKQNENDSFHYCILVQLQKKRLIKDMRQLCYIHRPIYVPIIQLMENMCS